MSGTYVKIYRDMFQKDLHGDGSCIAVFIYLISVANRFDRKFRGEVLPPGSIRRRISIICEDLGFSKKVTWRCINKLEKLQIISTDRGHRGTKITICNYLKYQCDENRVGDTEGTTKGTTEGDTEGTTEGVHNNKVNKEKKEKKERKKEEIVVCAANHPSLSVQNLISLWNDKVGVRLPRVDASKVNSTSQRYRHALARVKTLPDAQYWALVIERILASSFCLGANERAWMADFDFLVRSDTHTKVMEGKYDNRTGRNLTPEAKERDLQALKALIEKNRQEKYGVKP